MEMIPHQYLKKLIGAEGIWEIRVQFGNDIFRLLGFFYKSTFLVLTNGFAKKTQKSLHKKSRLPSIEKINIWQGEKMNDVKRYIQKRAERDPEFAENYEVGYADFKIGVILRQAREAAGLTQDEVAKRLQTQKSAISRIENHADDVRLSTIRRYAEAVGAHLQIRLANTPRL
jgi:HTH-type transcriptional regulator/antitoxin HipB